MKKVSCLILLSALMFAYSCNKSNNTLETWSFEGVNYNATSVTGHGAFLTATNIGALNPNSYVQLFCGFSQDTLPTASGTYTVINNTDSPLAGQVRISLILNGGSNAYVSTGGTGHQTVSVSVSGGKVSVVGTGISLVSYAAPDTAYPLNLNITQQ